MTGRMVATTATAALLPGSRGLRPRAFTRLAASFVIAQLLELQVPRRLCAEILATGHIWIATMMG
jgi:hypothetical protein